MAAILLRRRWVNSMQIFKKSKLSLSVCHQADAKPLTHCGWDKMDAILQNFQMNFFLMKMYEFWLKFHWTLFLGVPLIIFQHWFRWWHDTMQATSHYLNRWWLNYWCIYASLRLNELTEPRLVCCQLEPWETSVKFETMNKTFSLKKMLSAKCEPFCSGLNEFNVYRWSLFLHGTLINLESCHMEDLFELKMSWNPNSQSINTINDVFCRANVMRHIQY